MGRLVNQNVDKFKDIISLGEYRQTELNNYNKFLESRPIFITYYSQDSVLSTADTGMQTVERLVGSSSPIKYNQLKEFPLYGTQLSQIDINDGDFGLNPEFRSEGVILPGTITPKVGDFFTIDYMEKDYLFKVIDINGDTIKSNSGYYKIQFKFSKPEDDTLIENNIGEKYTVIYDNLGSNETRSIVRDDDFSLLTELKKIKSKLSIIYKDVFYNNQTNTFTFTEIINHEELPTCLEVYDIFLTYFLKKNKLIDSILLQVENTYKNFNLIYNNSIYGFLENPKRNIENIQFLFNKYFLVRDIPDYGSSFYIFDKEIYNIELKKDKENPLYHFYLDEDFIRNIEANVPYKSNDNLSKIKNCIIHYINGTDLTNEFLFETCSEIQYFIEDMKEYFLYIPILLFIINNNINIIIDNK